MFGLVTTFAALLAASATSMVASAPAASSLHLRDNLEDTLSRQESKRLVINPHITYPDETAVWHTGQKGVNATW